MRHGLSRHELETRSIPPLNRKHGSTKAGGSREKNVFDVAFHCQHRHASSSTVASLPLERNRRAAWPSPSHTIIARADFARQKICSIMCPRNICLMMIVHIHQKEHKYQSDPCIMRAAVCFCPDMFGRILVYTSPIFNRVRQDIIYANCTVNSGGRWPSFSK
ncbi:hypothetical protein B0O99DRAFT_351423 [Bisporella sp. PMI_857]|nr:hypothetical protein B0O99DRAFT_351423 [Bisporella sp. PMI_857]